MTTKKLKLEGDHCQCTVCLEYFNSTHAFDKHRYGPWENRKCTEPLALAILGWKKLGKGFWATPRTIRST